MRFRPTGDFKTFHYEPVGWGPLPHSQFASHRLKFNRRGGGRGGGGESGVKTTRVLFMPPSLYGSQKSILYCKQERRFSMPQLRDFANLLFNIFSKSHICVSRVLKL